MRPPMIVVAVLTGVVGCGCDSFRGPNLAIPTAKKEATAKTAVAVPPSIPPPADTKKNGTATVYGGALPRDWAKDLQSTDRAEVMEACRALRVLGPEGKPFLFQGLENPNAETRRLCFESLTLADFKRQHEEGRQRLVKLAGDKADIRIRERATALLTHWHSSVLAP